MAAHFCRNCGSAVSANVRFCPKCSKPVEQADQQQVMVQNMSDSQRNAPPAATDPMSGPEKAIAKAVAERPAQPPVQQDPEFQAAHAVECRNVDVFYGKKQAVQGVNLMFEPNKITALIGPSGCGKSTLLRSINRMHDLTPHTRVGGEILIDGKNIYGQGVDAALVRRRVGMVFQKPNPFASLSIYENCISGLRVNGESRADFLLNRAEEALKRAALWDEVKDKLDQSGTALSGGQQQRLCIARTVAMEPDVILMDEPCAALDPLATLKIEELMLELKKKYTIIIVTHNMQQAARVSDKTAFMLAGEERIGRLVEYGPTKKMFTDPSDERTEQYITGRFG